MNYFKCLNNLMIIGLLLFTSAADLRAQQLATNTQNDNDQKWLSVKLKRQKSFDGLSDIKLEDVNQFETLLVSTLAELEKPKDEISIGHLQKQWATLNWDFEASPSGKTFVIQEQPDHQYGRGAYAFRTDVKSRIILQSPHRFNDLMTGSIAIQLFCTQAVSAIALNTVHRSEIDLSHTNLHFINAFTSAIIKAHQDVTILQIHGFTNDGKTGAAKFTSIIVSDTTKFPGRSARQTALELKATFGADQARLFPVDIRQLGGTTNRQAKIAHGLGCPDFLHIELNREFREQLNADASVRESFFASVVRGVSK